MSKLLEWVSVVLAVFAVWFSVVGGYVRAPLLERWMPYVVVSPLLLVALFGLYALTTVLYRVFTFNECRDAAKELQAEILQARSDLQSQGLRW